MNIHLVNPLFQVIALMSLLFCVKNQSTASTQHHTLLYRYSHNNYGHIMAVLEAVQAHQHDAPPGLLGLSWLSHTSSSAHLGIVPCRCIPSLRPALPKEVKPKQCFFWPTIHIQVQIILSTVLLCHISSKGWQLSSVRHKLMWQIMEELTTKAKFGWLV